MKKNDEYAGKIKKITTELAALEKDGKVHAWAIIEPKRSEATNPQCQYLDTLARLLTGKETCVAIYQYEDKLLIASNKSEPKYAKKYLPVLQNFVNSLSRENYEQLIEIALRQIYSLKVKETRQRFKEEKQGRRK